MKNVILISIALVLCFTAFGQNVKKENVPAVVTAKFKTLFPKVDTVIWGKEDKNYEAEFKLNTLVISVLFDANGNELQTETVIAVTALPASATKYVKQHYNGALIKEASKIMDAKDVVTYEAEVSGKDVIFDSQGNFIKEVEDNDNE